MLIYALAGLLLVLVLAVGGLRWWVGYRLSADAIVAEMERNYNSRVEIGSRSIKVFSRPTRIEIDSVTMGPRDEFADQGIPASKRPPLGDGVSPLSLRHAVVTMNLPDLIRGNLDITEVRFSGLRAEVMQGEDGDNIGPLFDKPELINGEPNPKLVEQRLREEQKEREREERRQARREARREARDQARDEGSYEEWRAQDDAEREERRKTEEEEDEEDEQDDSPFLAEDLKMRLMIARGEIDDVEVRILSEDRATEFLLDEMRYGVNNADVDPDALEEFNHADLEVDGRLRINAMRSGREIAEVRFTGAGPMRPFELEEGSWLPDITLEVGILKGSRFSGLPMFESIGKWFELLASFGLSVTGLDLAGALVEDARTKMRYHDGLYEFIRRFDLVFENYRITVRGGAWINASTNEHRIRGTFLAEKQWTDDALAGIERFVGGVAGDDAADKFIVRVREAVVDEEGHFRLDFTSEGSLSSPDVDIRQKMPDLKDAARDVGRDALRNLFQ